MSWTDYYETQKFPHKVLELNVNVTANDGDIYEAARLAWRVDLNKARQAEVIVAVERGNVVRVFIPEQWELADHSIFGDRAWEKAERRRGFVGRPAEPAVRDIYLHQQMPKRRRGAATPVRYFYG